MRSMSVGTDNKKRVNLHNCFYVYCLWLFYHRVLSSFRLLSCDKIAHFSGDRGTRVWHTKFSTQGKHIGHLSIFISFHFSYIPFRPSMSTFSSLGLVSIDHTKIIDNEPFFCFQMFNFSPSANSPTRTVGPTSLASIFGEQSPMCQTSVRFLKNFFFLPASVGDVFANEKTTKPKKNGKKFDSACACCRLFVCSSFFHLFVLYASDVLFKDCLNEYELLESKAKGEKDNWKTCVNCLAECVACVIWIRAMKQTNPHTCPEVANLNKILLTEKRGRNLPEWTKRPGKNDFSWKWWTNWSTNGRHYKAEWNWLEKKAT